MNTYGDVFYSMHFYFAICCYSHGADLWNKIILISFGRSVVPIIIMQSYSLVFGMACNVYMIPFFLLIVIILIV